MKNMIALLLICFTCSSAGVLEHKKDTCSVPIKSKHEQGAKKVTKKRPLYQLIFMI